jgi:enediyne biosynthesis protein E4
MVRHPQFALAFLIAIFCMVTGCGEDNTPTPAPASSPGSPSPPAAGINTPLQGARAADDRVGGLSRDLEPPDTPQEPSVFRFVDSIKGSGIDFVQVSGMTPEKHFPTANGSGVAILDADGDGKMDLYFANCTYFPVGSKKTGPNRLYRNKDGKTFEDVTAQAGVGYEGFCHGIIVADVNNDGHPDLFLCNYGPNVLYLNDGKGHFRDVSKEAGIDRAGWSSGGAPIDYDNDGDLDLYVANYGEWDLKKDGDKRCSDPAGKIRYYCNPKEVKNVKHYFYRNDGLKDGVPHFTDVYDQFLFDESQQKFVPGKDNGHGFAAVAADVNGDGMIDLYVANDMNPNFLFLNMGGGKFRDAGDESGAAYDSKGVALSGMGVDAEDVDGDGFPELIATNFQNEPVTLYHNDLGAKCIFQEMAATYGLAADSMPWVKWGCLLGDFDNDGWPDCFVTTGHVDDNRPQMSYSEPPILFRNVAIDAKPKPVRRFRISTRDVGPYFSSKHVGRGAAFGDLDDDGRLDVVVNHKDAAPALLTNQTPANGNHWIRLNLKGTKSNRDAIGAKVEVKAGDLTIYRQRKGGCSMLSSNDPRILIGVGPTTKVARVTVHWPSGQPDTVLTDLDVDKTHEVIEPNGG